MQSSFRIFRIFGISVELHITFILFLLFALLDPVLFLLLVILFTIVLIHELFHSLVALKYGIAVPKITLTPIGGLSTIDIPESPKKEFLISLAGPSSNFLLALIIAVIAFLVNYPLYNFSWYLQGNINFFDPVSIINELFWVNILLGAFNLLPGFPMDGGRVFRAALAFGMDYLEATRVAVTVGRVIAILIVFMGLGLFSPVLGIFGEGFLTIIIGIFLFFAGGQELQVLQIKHALQGATVGKIALPDVKSVSEATTLKDFMETIASPQMSHYPVTDPNGKLVGILHMEDMRNVRREDFGSTLVRDVARKDVDVVDAGMKVEENISTLLGRDYILVVDSGKVVGYVTPDRLMDIARFYNVWGKK